MPRKKYKPEDVVAKPGQKLHLSSCADFRDQLSRSKIPHRETNPTLRHCCRMIGCFARSSTKATQSSWCSPFYIAAERECL